MAIKRIWESGLARNAASQSASPRRPRFSPDLDQWPDAGVYRLLITVRRTADLSVGALGLISFRRGMYVYTGRASRSLRARVLRHLRSAKRLHWHVDYLLSQPWARIDTVLLASGNPEEECSVNSDVPEDSVPVPSFGASDCSRRCPAHLWRLPPAMKQGGLMRMYDLDKLTLPKIEIHPR